METLVFKYKADQKLTQRAHVGVVGSGDLEILMVPSDEEQAHVSVRTGSEGFSETWKAVLDRFFSVHTIQAKIVINDFGATPGVVALRLAQALEVSENGNK